MDAELKQHIVQSGTSLVGIVCKEGVVMAGDKKSTLGGQITYRKDAEKVVQINDYLVVSGTGSSADIQLLKKLIRAELRLKELKSKKRPTVREAANLTGMIAYKNIRQPSMIPFIAGMMVGGFDEDGTLYLFSITPGGDIEEVKTYDANVSSGMPYILGFLERQYKEDISLKQGIELATESIKASSERDTASGLGVDVFIITKDGIKQVIKQEIVPQYTDRK